MTTGKTTALTRQTFVGKGMPLLFNMLSRLVITFLPRSKCLLISWLQSPSAVILEPRKIKSATVSTVSPSICHEVMGPDAMILVFRALSFSSQSPERGILTVLAKTLGQFRKCAAEMLLLLSLCEESLSSNQSGSELWHRPTDSWAAFRLGLAPSSRPPQ